MQEVYVENTGVGALIIANNKLLTVEELHTSRATQKIPGIRSLMYETLEEGEGFQEAICRVLTEEVNLGEFVGAASLTDTKLCLVQLNPGIWLHAFLLPLVIPPDFEVKIGTCDDVANPRWDLMDDILNCESGCLKFRPGNREVIGSFLRYRNGILKEPDIYFETKDRIPDYVFAGLPKGLEELES